MSDEDLSAEENRAISSLIREELARRRMTRAALADHAKLSLSTLEKAMSGQRPFTLATVVRLESALTLKLRKPTNGHVTEPAAAPDSLGSYSRPAVKWLEGNYLTLRPSFSVPKGIYAYRTGFLRRYAALAPAPAERMESLEQLRAMHHGYRIAVATWSGSLAPGVDTAEDLQQVRARFSQAAT